MSTDNNPPYVSWAVPWLDTRGGTNEFTIGIEGASTDNVVMDWPFGSTRSERRRRNRQQRRARVLRRGWA